MPASAIARSALIHPTAVVSIDATIGENSSIGPYSVIVAGVRIGKENRVGSHVVIEGNTIIGASNQIYQFASIGATPQDLKYEGEASVLRIGDRNIIREYTTLQPGTAARRLSATTTFSWRVLMSRTTVTLAAGFA